MDNSHPLLIGQSWSDPWILENTTQSDNSIVFKFEHKTLGEVSIILETYDKARQSFKKSESFNIYYQSFYPAKDEPAKLKAFVNEVSERILHNDKGNLKLVKELLVKDVVAGTNELPVGSPFWLSKELWKKINIGEQVAAVIFLVFAIFAAFNVCLFLIRKFAAFSKGEKILVSVLLLLSLALRLLVPYKMVMAYCGYEIISNAINFTHIDKYGAGTPSLFYPLLSIFPAAQNSYLLINTIIGWATIPLAASWLALYSNIKRSGFALLFLLAISPLLIKDHNSESIIITALFFYFVGLLNWEFFARNKSKLSLMLSLCALAFSITCRPMFIVLAPLTILLIEIFRAKKTEINKKHLLISLAIIAPLLLCHLAFFLVFALIESANQSSGGVTGILFGVPLFFSFDNLFINPNTTPAIFVLLFWLAFLKVFTKFASQKKLLLVLLLLGFFSFIIFFADAPYASYQRLQIPATYFLMMISAIGLIYLLDFKTDHKFKMGATLLILLACSMYWPIVHLWQATNEHEEHVTMYQLPSQLPKDSEITLARFARGDSPPVWGLCMGYADWLFDNFDKSPNLMPLDDFVYKYSQEKISGESYVYLGLRCYAKNIHKIPDSKEARMSYYHPACLQIREKFTLETVWEKHIKNHPIADGNCWYTKRDTLKIGLYKVMSTNMDKLIK